MPELRIRFVTESDLVSRAIRWVTFSDFSHVELELPDGTYLGAHASGGVQILPANYMKPSLERVYALPVSQKDHAAAMYLAYGRIGCQYSFADILGILFRSRLHHAPHGLICSWFVLDVMNAAGIYPLNVLNTFNYKVTPTMLHLSPVFIGKCVRQSARPI